MSPDDGSTGGDCRLERDSPGRRVLRVAAGVLVCAAVGLALLFRVAR